MLRRLHKKKAQVLMSEYVLIFIIIVGMLTAMTVYFRRGLQGQFRDATKTMVTMVDERTGDYYDGKILYGYEPYYTNVETTADSYSRVTKRLDKGGASGSFYKDFEERRSSQIISRTAPPKDFNIMPWQE